MGLLIRSTPDHPIHPPADCSSCIFEMSSIFDDGHCWCKILEKSTEGVRTQSRLDTCPISEVDDSGELIDKNAFLESCKTGKLSKWAVKTGDAIMIHEKAFKEFKSV